MNTLKLLYFFLVVSTVILTKSCKLPIVEPECPIVEGISSSTGKYGDTISITGKNFITDKPQAYAVSIGGKPVPEIIAVPNATTLSFKVPEGIGSGNVLVSLASGTACNGATPLTFNYRLTVSELRPFSSSASDLDQPQGMDIDTNNNVIVADRNNQVIKQIPSNGGTAVIIAGAKDRRGGDTIGQYNTRALFARFRDPEDVAVDQQGNIYIADKGNHCIRMMSYVAPDRNVYLAAGKIFESGDIPGKALLSRFTSPTGIAVIKDKNILTVEYVRHRMRYINFSDSSVNNLINGMPGLNFPSKVAYSEKRNLLYPIFIADKLNNRILQVNMEGMSNNSPISIPAPHDVVIDETGNIIVLKREGNPTYPIGVYIIYKDNSIVQIIRSTTAFQLLSPSGLAIDTKSKIIYISDDGLNRILSATYR